MNEKLTNEASWVTAASIIEYLGKSRHDDDAEFFAAIFERVKAGMLVHHFLARRPEPAAPSPN